VDVVDVPAMGAAVIPVVELLEEREGLQMAFHRCWLLICRGWMLRNAASALLLSQSPFIEIYLNLTLTSTGESTPPVHHGLISCQSVLLYLLSTFEL
jgi:hypothetical protein